LDGLHALARPKPAANLATPPIANAGVLSFGQRQCRHSVDKNRKGTYHVLIVIKEAMMQRVAVETLRDFAELVALGAFLTMIALAARAFGA